MTLDELRSIAPLAERTKQTRNPTEPNRWNLEPWNPWNLRSVSLRLRQDQSRPAILGTRADGYHDLRTVFQSTRAVRQRDRDGPARPVAVTCDEPDIPTDQRNLVWKAASLLHRVATGKSSAPRDITIDLRKRMPSEAGLGGGSSNAAMTLLALNKLWKLDLDLATLTRIGARLGADVPYFLVGGTALGLGRGDDIYPLADMPPCTSSSFAPASVSRPRMRISGSMASRDAP
jgi:4-diphosphocytidyl-2-C-methyl-D-erythritol kinase